MNKIIIIVTLLVAGGLIYWVANMPEQPTPNVDIVAEDRVYGNSEAPNVLIEYGDFQCPACAAYHPVVKEFVDKNPDDVKFVFRHFPLRSIHANAQLSSQASEAAHLQGKFWDMYDKLYVNQSEWSSTSNAKDIFIRYSKEIGLDAKKFEEDLNSDTVKNIVNNGYNSAIALRLNSTPTFFYNGVKIDSPSNLDGFQKLIIK